MPETIIDSFRFEGKTKNGVFNPDDKVFSISDELILSAARLTIVAPAKGRTHNTDFRIYYPDNRWANGGSEEVPEGEPILVGPSVRLHTFPPGDRYRLSITSYDYSPTEEEDVLVTIDLLKLDSDVAEVTRDVLRDAESELGINAIAFGISEASFTYLLTDRYTAPALKVGTTPHLELYLTLQSQWTPPWPFVHIIVSDKESANEFVISAGLLLTFHRAVEAPFGDPVAEVSATLNVHCKPAMVTTTKDTLQIQFRSVELLSTSLKMYDKTQTGILGGYASIPEFTEDANRYLEQVVVSQKGDLDFALPAYLKSRPMPDHWHHVINMELDFRHFAYRTVKVHGIQVSYLFIIFSMKSLGLPPPCFCETESASLQEASTPSAAINSLQNQKQQKRSLSQRDEVERPKPDWWRITVPAQIAAFGLSQQSFQEIARPHAEMGDDQNFSTGGDIYASARVWFSTRLEDAEITSDGVKAVFDITAEGTAKAAVRDKCGHDVLSVSSRLRVRVEDTSIKWSLRIISDMHQFPLELIIIADADAHVGEIHTTYDGALAPPPPLNRVDDWLHDTVINSLRPSLSKLASEKASIRLIQAIQNNDYMSLFPVDDRFFAGEAAVVLGQLRVHHFG
jgi:hypothetical protein